MKKTKTQTTGKPILDALLNASESFANETAASQNREQPQHSPLPWRVDFNKYDKQYRVYSSDPAPVVNSMFHAHDPADAKLIVASVNHADKLAEALRRIAYDEPTTRGCVTVALKALKEWNEAKQ